MFLLLSLCQEEDELVSAHLLFMNTSLLFFADIQLLLHRVLKHFDFTLSNFDAHKMT